MIRNNMMYVSNLTFDEDYCALMQCLTDGGRGFGLRMFWPQQDEGNKNYLLCPSSLKKHQSSNKNNPEKILLNKNYKEAVFSLAYYHFCKVYFKYKKYVNNIIKLTEGNLNAVMFPLDAIKKTVEDEIKDVYKNDDAVYIKSFWNDFLNNYDFKDLTNSFE